jgi:hypothetical protein
MLRLHEAANGGWRALRAERGVGAFCEHLDGVPEMLNQSIEPGHSRVFSQWYNVWCVHVEEVQGTGAEHVMHEWEPAVIGRVRGGAALRLRQALFMSDMQLDGPPSLSFHRHQWRAVEPGTGTRLNWVTAPYQIRLHRVVIVVRTQVRTRCKSVFLSLCARDSTVGASRGVHAGDVRVAAHAARVRGSLDAAGAVCFWSHACSGTRRPRAWVA